MLHFGSIRFNWNLAQVFPMYLDADNTESFYII